MTGEEIKALAKVAYCDDAEFESVWNDGDFRTFCAALLHEAMRTRPEAGAAELLDDARDTIEAMKELWVAMHEDSLPSYVEETLHRLDVALMRSPHVRRDADPVAALIKERDDTP